jgi:hypothetical protein
MTSSDKTLILAALFTIALIILGPVATIWSLNTLFPALDIPIDFDHWCAVVVLGGVFKTSVSLKK